MGTNLNTKNLDQEIDEHLISVNNYMGGFSSAIRELRNGPHSQKELAAIVAKAVKCSLCSIANMTAIADTDGLEALRECAAMESGCKEVVQSH